MQKIIEIKDGRVASKDLHRPFAIILVPNKELTAQVYVQFNKMLKFCKDIKVYSLLNTEASILEFNNVKAKTDIIITTPASLIKTWRKVDLDLKNIQYVVIDEADLMLEYGHKSYIQQLMGKEIIGSNINKSVDLMLFSATLNEKSLSKWQDLTNCHNIKFLDCNQDEDMSNRNIDEWKVLVDEDDKLLLLVSMFKLNLIPLKVLIFVNSVEKC